FSFTATPPPLPYPLSLHDALPISLDLGRAHAVPRHVDHIVDAPGDPPVAVGVAARAVAGEVRAREGLEIGVDEALVVAVHRAHLDRKSTRLNSSHSQISYAVFCLK